MVDNLFNIRRSDQQLSRNQQVVAHWTSNGYRYRAQATISALRQDHIIVTLTETVGSDAEFRQGKQIRIPRFSDQTRWSPRNCVQLISRSKTG